MASRRGVSLAVELKSNADGSAIVEIKGPELGTVQARITAAEIAERLVPRTALAEGVRNLVNCEHPAPMAVAAGHLWCARCGAMKALEMSGWHRPDEHAWLRDAVGLKA